MTSVPAQSFASLTGKPTTLAGYAITDAAPLSSPALTGTPTNSDIGKFTVILRATDSTGLTVDQEFELAVIRYNNPPKITSSPLKEISQDSEYNYTLIASDPDGDNISFSPVTIPSWLTFNTNNGKLTGTPSLSNVGDHTVKLRVTDSGGKTIDQEFTISVIFDPLALISVKAA